MAGTNTTTDRAAAIGTVVLSLVDAVGAAVALLPLGFGLVYYFAWGAVLNSDSGIEYWPVWALLITFTVVLICTVLWTLGALLVSRHQELGRRLVLAASMAALAGMVVAWTTPASNWGGFDALMYVLFAAAPLVFALLPGTRRWCVR